MRVNPEPLPVEAVVTSKKHDTVIRIIRRILEEDLQTRILEEESQGTVLITAPHYFATETGFGQPAGGRRHYLQLQITLTREKDKCTIQLSPYHYELRTSYAYGLEGQVKTLYKIYPYPEYPGMFDLHFLELELKRIATIFEHALRDIQ